MPKDADFNCQVADGRTPVDKYDGMTRGAHGAIDFWGNVWEWISTVRTKDGNKTMYGVKGGSYESERTDCRTENKDEARNGALAYEDVGFRVVQVLNYKDSDKSDNTQDNDSISKEDINQNNDVNKPENGSNDKNNNQKNNVYINRVDYVYNNNRLTLTWDEIEAVDTYYVYKYNPVTKRVSNPRIVMGNTSYTYHRAVANSTYFYIITTEKLSGRYISDDSAVITISLN